MPGAPHSENGQMALSVEFDSDLFTPFLPEEAQVNPAVYGAELAFWLARGLAESGVATSYPDHEDWGWYLEYRAADDGVYWLCCANRDGAKDRWRCFVEPRPRGLFGRGRAKAGGEEPLVRSLKRLLGNEPAIRNIHWEP